MRPALPLPRLGIRRGRPLHSAAIRGEIRSAGTAEKKNPDHGLPRSGESRAPLGLSRPAARAAPARLGALLVEKRIRADRVRTSAVQLAPGAGELDRPGALRMDARELEDPARRRDRTLRGCASEDRLRRIRAWLRLQARARGLG